MSLIVRCRAVPFLRRCRSYQGQPTTRPQQLEVTLEEATKIRDRMPGIPVMYNHKDSFEVGRVVDATITASATGKGYHLDTTLSIDGTSGEAEGLRQIIRDGGLEGVSLRHLLNAAKPIEMSVCVKGARAGSGLLGLVEGGADDDKEGANYRLFTIDEEQSVAASASAEEQEDLDILCFASVDIDPSSPALPSSSSSSSSSSMNDAPLPSYGGGVVATPVMPRGSTTAAAATGAPPASSSSPPSSSMNESDSMPAEGAAQEKKRKELALLKQKKKAEEKERDKDKGEAEEEDPGAAAEAEDDDSKDGEDAEMKDAGAIPEGMEYTKRVMNKLKGKENVLSNKDKQEFLQMAAEKDAEIQKLRREKAALQQEKEAAKKGEQHANGVSRMYREYSKDVSKLLPKQVEVSASADDDLSAAPPPPQRRPLGLVANSETQRIFREWSQNPAAPMTAVQPNRVSQQRQQQQLADQDIYASSNYDDVQASEEFDNVDDREAAIDRMKHDFIVKASIDEGREKQCGPEEIRREIKKRLNEERKMGQTDPGAGLNFNHEFMEPAQKLPYLTSKYRTERSIPMTMRPVDHFSPGLIAIQRKRWEGEYRRQAENAARDSIMAQQRQSQLQGYNLG